MVKTILHVDDERPTLALVKEIFEKEGYKIDSAASGAEALKKLKESNYDLILLDVMMPDMSGWDVFEKIKKDFSDRKVKVAFLSVVEVSSERRDQLKKEGLADYILKPFSVAEIKKRVTALLK
jgi:DNA-binding response OmpR family regulator